MRPQQANPLIQLATALLSCSAKSGLLGSGQNYPAKEAGLRPSVGFAAGGPGAARHGAADRAKLVIDPRAKLRRREPRPASRCHAPVHAQPSCGRAEGHCYTLLLGNKPAPLGDRAASDGGIRNVGLRSGPSNGSWRSVLPVGAARGVRPNFLRAVASGRSSSQYGRAGPWSHGSSFRPTRPRSPGGSINSSPGAARRAPDRRILSSSPASTNRQLAYKARAPRGPLSRR